MMKKIAWLLLLSLLLPTLAACGGILPAESESVSETGSAEESDGTSTSTVGGVTPPESVQLPETLPLESMGLPNESEETEEHFQTKPPMPDNPGDEHQTGNPSAGESGDTEPSSGTCGKEATWSFEDGVLTISGKGVLKPGDWHHLSNDVRRIVVEDGITELADSALADFHRVIEISLPASVRTYGRFLFSHDDELSILRISDLTKREWDEQIKRDERFTFEGIEQALVLMLADATLTVEPHQHEHETGPELPGSGGNGEELGPELPEQSEDESKGGQLEPPEQSEETDPPLPPEQSEDESKSNQPELPEQSEETDPPLPPEQSEDESKSDQPEQSEETDPPLPPEQSEDESKSNQPEVPEPPTDSQKCGENARWEYDSGEKRLRIYGTGTVTEESWGSRIGNEVLTVVIEEGITGLSCYISAPQLQSLSLPNTLTAIRQSAFFFGGAVRFLSLPRVDAKGSGTAHDLSYIGISLHELRRVTVLGGTEIGDRAFESADYLTEVVLPASVTRIGTYAFSYCPNLEFINVQRVKTFDKEAFSYCEKLAWVDLTSAETIGDSAFCSTALTELAFGDALTDIGQYAFYGVRELTSVTFGDNVRTVGNGAFADCPAIATLSLNEGLEEIGTYAFSGKFTVVVLPATLRVLGSYAFELSTVKSVTLSLPLVNEKGNAVTLSSAFSFHSDIEQLVIREGTARVTEGFAATCGGLVSVSLPESITVIEKSAFEDCYNLETVERAGNRLTEIGDEAFYGCGALAAFTFDETLEKIGAHAFDSTAITECILPEGLLSIGNSAFSSCSTLTTVYIPSTVLSIGYGAFNGHVKTLTAPLLHTLMSDSDRRELFTAVETVTVIGTPIEIPRAYFESSSYLRTVNLPGSVTKIGAYAFASCEALTAVGGGSIKEIGDYAFSYCKRLSAFAFGDRLETIGEYAFEYAGFVTVTLPDSVQTVGEGAFEYAQSLQALTLGSGVKRIGEYAFSYCSRLSLVSLNEGLVEIGGGAFEYCAISEISLPSTLCVIGSSALYGSPIVRITLSLPLVDENGRAVCMEDLLEASILQYATVREGVTELPANFFEYCGDLIEVDLPASLQRIGTYAFHECESLERINRAGTGLVEIDEYAFALCTSLTEFTFDATLKHIGEGAFCESALERAILPEGLLSIGRYAFDGSAITELYVPASVSHFDGCYDCPNLTKVSLPIAATDGYLESVFDGCPIEHVVILGNPSEIGESYFSNLDTLRSVTIPVSVTFIGEDAFANLPSLEAIRYEGTMAQWLAITRGGDVFYGTSGYEIIVK